MHEHELVPVQRDDVADDGARGDQLAAGSRDWLQGQAHRPLARGREDEPARTSPAAAG